ncbi:MAG: Na+/H+ antiporter NhaC family protein [Calditrichaeota bacterium]|nr:Na+/H+ antiporter NhaC family protein [Calditrichota bacterium]
MKHRIFKNLLIGLFLLPSVLSAEAAHSAVQRPQAFTIKAPAFAVSKIPFRLEITALTPDGKRDFSFTGPAFFENLFVEENGQILALVKSPPFKNGLLILKNAVLPKSGTQVFRIRSDQKRARFSLRVIPGILTILPPLLAIFLALIFRQVVISLFSGVWLGAIFIYNNNILTGYLKSLDTYIVNSLVDHSHASIIVFSLCLGGMVGIISKAGGTAGIVEAISKFAKKPRGGQIAAWAMGLFIFFDDYANTLIVGNTMRPFTDRLKISREKLSYIVDSTAAPVVSVAVISTWVGFQVGLIQSAFDSLGLHKDAYFIFLQTIPYSYYSWITIAFVFLVALLMRDFGPMYKAEKRSLSTGFVLSKNAQPLADTESFDILNKEADIPLRWYNAIIPILILIVVTFIGMYFTGLQALGKSAGHVRFGEIIGNADSFAALTWGTVTGILVAAVLAISQKILTLQETFTAWLGGVKAMVLAMVILVLAWAIGQISADLHTADYVVETTRGLFSPRLLPAITFTIAAFISFATGTSWATMAILTPIVIPIAYKMTGTALFSADLSHTILLGTIGAVLSGSIFGDHCSPISDTTIMSSMASAADHIDHVRTQLPYALAAAGIALVFGYLPAGWDFHPLITIPMGIGVIVLLLLVIGKRPDR